MTNKKVDFVVGLFVLAGIVAVLFLALRAGNLGSFTLDSGYDVVAKFDNIGSLKKRAPVKSSGVVVGRVQDISFDNKEFKAVVKMNIKSGYKFSTESTAAIKTSGLLGEQFIDLAEGPDDESLLQDGSEIIYANSAMSLEDLISKIGFSSVEEAGTAQPAPSSDSSQSDSSQAPAGNDDSSGFHAPGVDPQ